MLAASGEQFLIEAAGYAAVVTESGATLRALTLDGRDLVDGFGEDDISSGGRGQLLMPWPNRIRDGRYEFGGQSHQLPLTEPSRHNASHGLVRWAAWSLLAHRSDHVALCYRLMAQTGYPWTLDLQVEYAVGEDGLRVTQSATNRSGSPAPYASGAHPYLTLGPVGASGPVDGWTLELPAATRMLSDDRLLPVGREDVTGTAHDHREAHAIGDTVFDHAFTDLVRDDDGLATTTVTGPDGRGVALWVDGAHPWLMVYSGDDSPTPRRSLAVEPMTAPVDAFRSGEDLLVLAPGETFSATWGIRAV